jgi:hypothetical protein
MLGRYIFTDHTVQGVWLSDNADGYLIADAVKIISVFTPKSDEDTSLYHAEVAR